MTLEITILASGSKGNAMLIHSNNEGILIDNGLGYKEISRRLENEGLEAGIIKAICITHAHSDHMLGVSELSNILDIPVYITQGTYEIAHWLDIGENKARIFNEGDSFEHNPFSIQSFKVSHDIGAPVGYVIQCRDLKIGIATDLGMVDDDIISALKGCNTIILESNHDKSMLLNSNRPQFLKDRISGVEGHLSNTQCAEALKEIVTSETSHVILCHLSQDCNTPELALLTAGKALENHKDVNIIAASQDDASTIKLFNF